MLLDGDNASSRILLAIHNPEDVRHSFSGIDLLIIDEAQRFHGIKPAVQQIMSTLPQLRLLLVCSFISSGIAAIAKTSSFIFVGPLSTTEIYDQGGLTSVTEELPQRLVYGNYPAVYLNAMDREAALATICKDSLHVDILQTQGIRRPSLLNRLLLVLAMKLGSQVTYSELAAEAGMDTKTAEKYLDLLERAFLVYRIWSYSAKVANELRHSFKVYFWDNGIRNWAVADFRGIDKRQDADVLWQNYFITERRKAMLYSAKGVRQHFWRSTQKQEVGLVELSGRRMAAYGMKWAPTKILRIPLTFRNNYPYARLETVNRFNYLAHTLQSQMTIAL
jgi:predicted AAA+ superfamily ATPase